MTDFHEGDLIEAVKGKAKIGGVVSNWSGGGLGIEDTGWSIEALVTHGYTVAVIERAKPALPTTPGAYKYDGGWCSVAVLNDVGEWRDVYGNRLTVTHLDAPRLTPLAPVAETAKKVLDALVDVSLRITGTVDSPYRSIYDDNWDAIAAEFGVTGGLGE